MLMAMGLPKQQMMTMTMWYKPVLSVVTFESFCVSTSLLQCSAWSYVLAPGPAPMLTLLSIATTTTANFTGNYRQGQNRFIYRDKLNRMHRRSLDKMEVDLQHLGEYDPEMLGLLRNAPATYLPAMELAAMDALKTLLYEQQQQASADDPANEDDEDPTQTGEEAQQQAPHDPTLDLANTKIQLLLRGNLASTPLRKIKSEHMNKLLKCPGIVISTSPVKSRATQLLIRCHRCLHEQQMGVLGGPYAGATLPRRCSGADPGQCGPFPYAVVPDLSDFVDRQSWKLQESPETVPTGEMPRSVMLAVERSLVDKAPPGTRVQVLCIPTLFQTGKDSVKSVYLQVVGLDLQNAPGDSVVFTPHEEAAFSALSKHSDVYAILSRSMAPSISGSYTHDIKKAMLCMLMGGTRKKLPDGVKLRGDINVLMLGDPSTAKSQFLKFASRVAPVGIYTSGKGSSAAGLTASVVKDAKGEFYLEGGAMVLADGGIVCIDEFDKMRPQDRVAIHEAMEQQTISIAKAGITTVLNSRSSVLAAANPVFGRYDELKSASENIDLMTTILSRFDLIFLVRDVREEERDRMICEHVMGVHMQHSGSGAPQRNSIFDSENDQQLMHNQEASADAIADHIKKVAETGEGELSVPALKKYIQYCKAKCTPRLSETSGDQLVSNYVRIRNEVRKRNIEVRDELCAQ
jgi:DNA replication licensing factor MCM5